MTKVILFGAGPSGERALLALQAPYEVLGFCDNNWQKFPGGFCGLPVISPAELPAVECDHVVLATGYACQVREQLLSLGIPAGRLTGVDYYAEATPALLPAHTGYLSIPGVTTLEERNWLFNYAARTYDGQGAVVELGVWLGAFSRALIDGLMRGEHPASVRNFHFFDTFAGWSGMAQHLAGWSQASGFPDGQSFLAGFRAAINPWEEQCHVHAEDLAECRWQRNNIELLVVDAMNSWPLALRIAREFFPCLVPQIGVVFHQDYAHWSTPWLHLIMYRLREYFCAEDDVPGGTVVFRCTRPIPAEILADVEGYDSFAADEVDAALEFSLQQIGDPAKQPGVLAAFVHANVACGRLSVARDILAAGLAEDPGNHELDLAARLLPR